MNKNWLIEIMKMPKIGISDEISLLGSFALLQQYVNVEVISDSDGNITYEAYVDDIVNSNITDDILIKLNQNGWSINDENTKIIKRL